MDGVIVVNKELRYTSRNVVNHVAGYVGTRKVGHNGTLDPLATGVLVLSVGKALKISEFLLDHDKEYIAEITLGLETDTIDMEGKIIKETIVDVTDEEIIKVIKSFKGKYMQEVPKLSAIKINGRSLYDYTRSGKEMPLPQRLVNIKSIDLIGNINFVNNKKIFKIKVTVSKGTYIRSLVKDICNKLNTIGCLTALTRTRQGNFTLDMAYSLDDIQKGNYKIISIIDAMPNIKRIVVDDDMAFKIRNGVAIDNLFSEDKAFILDGNNVLIALYKNDNGKARVCKMF